jgi:hypothetical protein
VKLAVPPKNVSTLNEIASVVELIAQLAQGLEDSTSSAARYSIIRYRTPKFGGLDRELAVRTYY